MTERRKAKKTYADIVDLVSDDQLWAKKGQLVASTLEARASMNKALDEAVIELFTDGVDLVSKSFITSTGRPGRIVIAVGPRACKFVDDDLN